MALDLVLGDPPRLHSVCGFGRLAQLDERALWRDSRRRCAWHAGLLITMTAAVAFPSVTNFLLVEAPGRGGISDKLRARGIAVRPAANFPGLGDSFFRVAVRGAADNRRLARALRAVMADA